MRGSGVVAIVIAAACAVGGEESTASFGPNTFGGDGSDTGSGSGGDDDDDGSGATTDADTAADTTAAIDSDGGTSTSSDASSGGETAAATETGDVVACEAALETFAANPGWSVMGQPADGTAFGWVGSAFAGGDSGEIGGTLQRAGTWQHFADTSVVVLADDCVAAEGTLVAPSEDADYNSTASFGHFSIVGSGPHIGFTLGEGDSSTLRVFVVAGELSQQVFLIEDIATPRAWSYVYDPAAATITFTMDGLGTEIVPVDAATVGDPSGIDAFGMFKTEHETPEQYPGLLTLYLDEITYTR